MAGLILLAGCARNATGPVSGPGEQVTTRTSTPPVDNRQAALTDLAHILASFPAPPGATSISGPPPGAVDLNQGEPFPGALDQVSKVTWWRVTGGAQATIARVLANPPAGASHDGSSSDRGQVVGEQFGWPGVPGVLSEREMLVSVAPVGQDTVIRVAAMVSYLPQRPADATVPTSGDKLIVELTPIRLGAVTDADTYGPVTVTDRDRIAKVAGLINAQPMSAPGARPCPPPPTVGGGSMIMVFSSDGTTTHTVDISLTGCQGITVHPAGGAPVTLDGGSDQVNQIIALLDLSWPRQ